MKAITADTLYLILPGKVSQLSMLIAKSNSPIANLRNYGR